MGAWRLTQLPASTRLRNLTGREADPETAFAATDPRSGSPAPSTVDVPLPTGATFHRGGAPTIIEVTRPGLDRLACPPPEKSAAKNVSVCSH